MDDFIVRTVREGTLKTTQEIEDLINKIAKPRFDDRYLGSVVVIVEKEAGKITKQKYRFAADNDPNFDAKVKPDAEALLAAVVKLVNGGGDEEEVRLKVVSKK